MRLRILFAEDNPRDRAPVSEYLIEKGCDVVEVCDPDQAQVALKEGTFDAIILDLIMPEDNPEGGKEVLKYMKRHGISTPVILATAWGYNGPAQDATRANPEVVKCILTKTFTPKELWAALSEVTRH
jgi:CheY-like chemotaxis protein